MLSIVEGKRFAKYNIEIPKNQHDMNRTPGLFIFRVRCEMLRNAAKISAVFYKA